MKGANTLLNFPAAHVLKRRSQVNTEEQRKIFDLGFDPKVLGSYSTEVKHFSLLLDVNL